MTNDPLFNQWREIGWRRKLTAEEEARLTEWLGAHPEAQADLESDAALNDLLSALPNAPVASNFTARVLQAAEREESTRSRHQARARYSIPWWRRWAPKAAMAAAVLAAGLLSYDHFQSLRRAEWAQSVATVSQVAAVPSPQVLSDYDTIAVLSSTPSADEELLKIMQ
jgi:anti-sigma factor RsiW